MRTREEHIKPWGYISPFAKKCLQYSERCNLTITRKSTVSETMAGRRLGAIVSGWIGWRKRQLM